MEKLSYNNIFDAITEDGGEAADLKFRADLLLVIRKIVESRGLSQSEIISVLGVPQPRVSELMKGKINKLSSDKLIGYLAKLGIRFKPEFKQVKYNKAPVKCTVYTEEYETV